MTCQTSKLFFVVLCPQREIMKTLAALVVYCLLFTVAFVTIYPLYSAKKKGVPWTDELPPTSERIGKLNKAGHVLNVVEQRQVLGIYEDSQSLSSQRSSPDEDPQYVCTCCTCSVANYPSPKVMIVRLTDT